MASVNGHHESVQLLLKWKADPNRVRVHLWSGCMFVHKCHVVLYGAVHVRLLSGACVHVDKVYIQGTTCPHISTD